MNYTDYKKTRAVVIERPRFANLREITLTEPREDAYICQTLFSAISTGTEMKTYNGHTLDTKIIQFTAKLHLWLH